MKRSRWKITLLIPIIILLFALPNVSAMFQNQGNASNGARVAAFNITETGTLTDYLAMNIVPGYNEGGKIVLTNSSEVAVDCNITITKVTDNIGKLTATLYASPSDKEVTKDSSNTNNNTWTYIDRLEPNQKNVEYQLILNWQAIDINAEDTNLKDIGKVDYFTVTVKATQVD
jgi:hypothetical protein